MEYYNKIKNYLLNRGSKKNIQNLIIIFIIGLIIILAANFFMSSGTPPGGYVEINTNSDELKNISPVGYEEKLKQELIDVLSEIEGVGSVKVMIYFDSSSETIPAYNQNDSIKVTEENDGNGGKRVTNENNNNTSVVTTSEGGGNKPFVIKEIKPKIAGVIVISEGANNPEVKYKLFQAVKTVFNIEQYKVNIYPMKKNK